MLLFHSVSALKECAVDQGKGPVCLSSGGTNPFVPVSGFASDNRLALMGCCWELPRSGRTESCFLSPMGCRLSRLGLWSRS
jgi:hypothetical protein